MLTIILFIVCVYIVYFWLVNNKKTGNDAMSESKYTPKPTPRPAPKEEKKIKEPISPTEEYAEYYGLEKPIKWHEWKRDYYDYKKKEAEKNIRTRYIVNNALANSIETNKKGSDWAVWGGIANGLGGPAAGLATASSIQAENASIRAQNERNRQLQSALLQQSELTYRQEMNSPEVKWDLHSYGNERLLIRDIREKKVFDIPADELIKYFKVWRIEIREKSKYHPEITTFLVSVKISDDLPLMDGKETCIDGTYIAHLFYGEREIASERVILDYGFSDYIDEESPYKVEECIMGQGKGSSSFVYFSLKNIEDFDVSKYRVTLSPYKLWLVEQFTMDERRSYIKRAYNGAGKEFDEEAMKKFGIKPKWESKKG